MTQFFLDEESDRIVEVDLDNIRINPFQPRKQFAEIELTELAQSIRAVGIIHPPLVRLIEDGFYELISGERRFQASKLAGLKKIPVYVKKNSCCDSATIALIENIQRVDLNPIEIAKALRRLIEEFNFGQEALSTQIGKKRSTVANYLRLLTLPKNIQDSVLQEHISMGHAKAILSLEGFEKQILLHEIILRDDLNVREAEQAALRINEKCKKKKLVCANRDFILDQLAEKIQAQLGTKVHIQGMGKRGRILIDYYNLDDLDRLLNLFGVSS
jgi:ParB family transcriptional regulator, chromosome partitioning protein